MFTILRGLHTWSFMRLILLKRMLNGANPTLRLRSSCLLCVLGWFRIFKMIWSSWLWGKGKLLECRKNCRWSRSIWAWSIRRSMRLLKLTERSSTPEGSCRWKSREASSKTFLTSAKISLIYKTHKSSSICPRISTGSNLTSWTIWQSSSILITKKWSTSRKTTTFSVSRRYRSLTSAKN